MTPADIAKLRAARAVLANVGGRHPWSACTCSHHREDHINLGKGEGIWCVAGAGYCDCKRFTRDKSDSPYAIATEERVR